MNQILQTFGLQSSVFLSFSLFNFFYGNALSLIFGFLCALELNVLPYNKFIIILPISFKRYPSLGKFGGYPLFSIYSWPTSFVLIMRGLMSDVKYFLEALLCTRPNLDGKGLDDYDAYPAPPL